MVTINLKFRKSTKHRKGGRCFIQLSHQRKIKTISTDIQLQAVEWNTSQSCVDLRNVTFQRGKELIQIQEMLQEKITVLQAIVDDLEAKGQAFTLSTIVEVYQNYGIRQNFFAIMENRISDLKRNGQCRTASNYRSTMRMFASFCGTSYLAVTGITSIYIKQFETYLLAKGNSLNTISFYMRILRATYNHAVIQGWIKKDKDPFKNVYTGCERTVKRAVAAEVVRLLVQLDLSEYPKLELARDIFLFSIYMLGMAFVDVAHMKKNNLHGEYLEYRRRKTKQTLQIFLPNCAKQIIEKYADKGRGDTFLFPILNKLERTEMTTAYANALRQYNRNLKKLSLMIGFNDVLTSYVARHTWATLAKNEGVATFVISEALGHTSEKTTRIYLDSIDNRLINKANEKVIALLLMDKE